MNEDDKEFLQFITGTLIPDLDESKMTATADDFRRLVLIIRKLVSLTLFATDLKIEKATQIKESAESE